MTEKLLVCRGNIIFSKSRDELSVYENSYIVVQNGKVRGIFEELPEEYSGAELDDYGSSLIIPAFCDLHVHAPQYRQRGTGMDMPLYDWLNSYTFPEESKFESEEYARTVYDMFARDLIRNGTFHVSAFASIHAGTAGILAEILDGYGIKGYVGKVNMDMNSPDYLTEDTEESLYNTEEFLASFASGSGIQPILTPRFAPTCSEKLLSGLGRLSGKYGVGMQTHLVESKWEAAEALKLFPEASCDAGIYEQSGLLDNGKCIFAHFIFPTDEDIRIARRYGAYTVHCPEATNNIIAGIMPVSRVQNEGIKVSSGTDVGAGSSLAVYRQIARSVQLSKLKDFYEGDESGTITFPNAFFMATREGGSFFGNCGAFDEGYSFDALVIDGPEDEGMETPPAELLERFCYSGDDRNISARYIGGKICSDI